MSTVETSSKNEDNTFTESTGGETIEASQSQNGNPVVSNLQSNNDNVESPISNVNISEENSAGSMKDNRSISSNVINKDDNSKCDCTETVNHNIQEELVTVQTIDENIIGNSDNLKPQEPQEDIRGWNILGEIAKSVGCKIDYNVSEETGVTIRLQFPPGKPQQCATEESLRNKLANDLYKSFQEYVTKHERRGGTNFKGSLQEALQQRDKTGMIPAYNTKPKDNGFESTITIDGKTYTSSKAHKRKKDAEEEVAKIAFEDLKIDKTRKTDVTQKYKDKIKDKPPKNLLQELAQQCNQTNPVYKTTERGMGIGAGYVCKVTYGGKEYTAEAQNKKAAETATAMEVLKAVLGEDIYNPG